MNNARQPNGYRPDNRGGAQTACALGNDWKASPSAKGVAETAKTAQTSKSPEKWASDAGLVFTAQTAETAKTSAAIACSVCLTGIGAAPILPHRKNGLKSRKQKAF